jgi:hypothetical protein
LIIPYTSSLTFNFTSFDPNDDRSIIYDGSANPASSAIQLTINQQGKFMNESISRASYYQPIYLWNKITQTILQISHPISLLLP